MARLFAPLREPIPKEVVPVKKLLGVTVRPGAVNPKVVEPVTVTSSARAVWNVAPIRSIAPKPRTKVLRNLEAKLFMVVPFYLSDSWPSGLGRRACGAMLLSGLPKLL